jgi:uncharacterized protein (DUF1015 family)
MQSQEMRVYFERLSDSIPGINDMADLHPFRAIRPVPELAGEIVCVPYDVIDASEAKVLARGKEKSFLHVIRPEIDLPDGTSEYAPEVYETGASFLRQYIDSPDSIRESEPSLYVYRLVMEGRSQTGIFGCVSVADYDNDVILKHEKTRVTKEDDRTRHILTQHAHAEPIMLTYRGQSAIDAITSATMEGVPVYDLTEEDGVRHTIWKIDAIEEMCRAFEQVTHLYVADGHHRCKAASRAAEVLSTDEGVSDEVGFFPAVLFPMADMKILAYNRIIKTLPESPEAFLARLRETLVVTENAPATPPEAGWISISFGREWYGVQLPGSTRQNESDRLDVGRLSEFILSPLLGIVDPRTDSNIDFVGGIRGTEELERHLAVGNAQMAISMYPTSIEELVAVSDAHLLMPPKSTWFEPKLRSGFLVHTF